MHIKCSRIFRGHHKSIRMKIYTKTGDRGQTALFDGRCVSKNNLRIETYGTVDELNSHLGLANADCRHADLHELLAQLQRQLFAFGADLATPHDSKNASKIKRIGPSEIAFLEQHIDAATAALPPLKHFVLPGGSPTASRLHVARTVCRRAERLLVTLMAAEPDGPDALIYLNRLSDLIFTLARRANQLDAVPDVEWLPENPQPKAPRPSRPAPRGRGR